MKRIRSQSTKFSLRSDNDSLLQNFEVIKEQKYKQRHKNQKQASHSQEPQKLKNNFISIQNYMQNFQLLNLKNAKESDQSEEKVFTFRNNKENINVNEQYLQQDKNPLYFKQKTRKQSNSSLNQYSRKRVTKRARNRIDNHFQSLYYNTQTIARPNTTKNSQNQKQDISYNINNLLTTTASPTYMQTNRHKDKISSRTHRSNDRVNLSEVQTLRKQNAGLEWKVQALKHKLKSKSKKLQHQMKLNQELQQEQAQFQQLLNQQMKKFSQLRKVTHQKDQHIQRLNKQQDLLQEEMSLLTESSGKYLEEIERLETESQEQKLKIENMFGIMQNNQSSEIFLQSYSKNNSYLKIIQEERDCYFKILEKLRLAFNQEDFTTLERKIQQFYKHNKNMIRFCEKLKKLAVNFPPLRSLEIREPTLKLLWKWIKTLAKESKNIKKFIHINKKFVCDPVQSPLKDYLE